MSQNLNLNILVQSVENLSQQVEKNQTVMQQDKVSLVKAEALLEGLKGMFGIHSLSMESSGDRIALKVSIDGNNAEFVLDPAQQLKLFDVKVTDGSGSVIDTKDILRGSLGLEQPNDIRQAMFLVSELLLNPSA